MLSVISYLVLAFLGFAMMYFSGVVLATGIASDSAWIFVASFGIGFAACAMGLCALVSAIWEV